MAPKLNSFSITKPFFLLKVPKNIGLTSFSSVPTERKLKNLHIFGIFSNNFDLDFVLSRDSYPSSSKNFLKNYFLFYNKTCFSNSVLKHYQTFVKCKR